MSTNASNNKQGTLTTAGGRPLPRRWLAVVAAVWIGFAFTSFASMAANYAAVWYVTESTGSPLTLAFLYVCALLPVGLLSPLGGVLADRFNRKHIIIACDLFIAAVALGVAIAITLGHVSLGLILIMVVACGAGQAFRSPAFNATTPHLVPEKHLLRINALNGILQSASMICAPALGIFLYTTMGFQAVLFLDAIGAIVSVLAMLMTTVPTIATRSAKSPGILREMKEGWGTLSSNRGLFSLVICAVLGMAAYAPLESLMPLMVSSNFNGDGYMASLVTGVFGVGMLAGSAAVMALGQGRKLTRIIAAASLAVGGATFVAGLLPESLFPVFVITIGIMAVGCAGLNGPLMTLLQKNVSEDKLGRVMGLFSTFMGLGMPLGTVIGGVVAQSIGSAGFYVVDGIFIIVLGVILMTLPSVRALDQHVAENVTIATQEGDPQSQSA